MRERERDPIPADDGDATLHPQTSEDDYSGRDGGTPNSEAVDASRPGDRRATPSRDPDQQPAPPEETRSPTPPPARS